MCPGKSTRGGQRRNKLRRLYPSEVYKWLLALHRIIDRAVADLVPQSPEWQALERRNGEEESGVRARASEGEGKGSLPRSLRARAIPLLSHSRFNRRSDFTLQTRLSLKRIQNYFTLINKSSEQCSIGTNMLLSLTITGVTRCMSFYIYLQIIKT